MALGVVLHAAIPYIDRPLVGLTWAVEGPIAEVGSVKHLDVLFWWLHVWRVPLFFVLAGFFSAMLIERRGVRAYLKQRNNRVLWPTLTAILLLLPICFAAFGWGWVSRGLISWEDLLHLRIHQPLSKDEVLGPAHLWFLIDLYGLGLIYAVGALVVARVGLLNQWKQSPMWIGVCVAGIVGVAMGWPEVGLAFANDWLGRPVDWVYHGCFFFVGVVIWPRREKILGWLGKTAGLWWLAALALGAVLIRADRGGSVAYGAAARWLRSQP